MIPLESVRARLALLWFAGSGVLFLLLVGQTLGGIFQDRIDKAWGWAIPNIAPTLSLMVSVFAADALSAGEDKFNVSKVFSTLSFGLSAFYLLNLIIVVIAAPYSVGEEAAIGSHPVDVMQISNFWLGPLQGLAAGAIGALFFTKTKA